MSFFSQIFLSVIDFLFPKICCCCGMPGATLCLRCAQSQLDPYWVQQCHICRHESRIRLVHKDCAESSYLDGLLVGFFYSGLVERLVAEIKYQFAYSGSQDLAKLMWYQLGPTISSLPEITLTYVPASKHRERWRGFNQSELICRELARLAGKRYYRLLDKPSNTGTQVHHNRSQRLQNLRGAFVISSGARAQLECNAGPVLIVDDISTTGSTLEMCAKVLKTVTDRPVFGVVFARGS